jgi:tetratricopeptide (TPR) repeat protein
MRYECYNCGGTDIRLVSAVRAQSRRSFQLLGLNVFTSTTEFAKGLKPPSFFDRLFHVLLRQDPEMSHKIWRDEHICMSCGRRSGKMLFIHPDDWERELATHRRDDPESKRKVDSLAEEVARDPSNLNALGDLVAEHLHRGEYIEAVKHAEMLVLAAPKSTAAWMLHGDSFAGLRQLEQAESSFLTSAEHGNRRNAMASVGRVRVLMGKVREAQAAFIESYKAEAYPWNMSPEEVRSLALKLGIVI